MQFNILSIIFHTVITVNAIVVTYVMFTSIIYLHPMLWVMFGTLVGYTLTVALMEIGTIFKQIRIRDGIE